MTRSKSKKITVKQLESIPRKKKAKDSKFFPLRRREEPKEDSGAVRPHIRHHVDDNEIELDIPDMFSEPEKAKYYASDNNRDKVTLTRFVNAGILTAVVCGVQRRLGGNSKR